MFRISSSTLRHFKKFYSTNEITRQLLIEKINQNSYSKDFSETLLNFETENVEMKFLCANYLFNHLNHSSNEDFESNKIQIGTKILSNLENLEGIPESKFLEACVYSMLENEEKMKEIYELLKKFDLKELSSEQLMQMLALAAPLGKFQDVVEIGNILEGKSENFLLLLQQEIEKSKNLVNYPQIYRICKDSKLTNKNTDSVPKKEILEFSELEYKLIKVSERTVENNFEIVTMEPNTDWESEDDIPPIRKNGEMLTWIQVDVGIPLTGVLTNENLIIFEGGGIHEVEQYGKIDIELKYVLTFKDNELQGNYNRRIRILKTKEENSLEFQVRGKLKKEEE
jgi:hypothetical protein